MRLLLKTDKKIAEKTARIGVIGLGYVGLPLALLAGFKGFTVLGFDQDQSRVACLNEGKSYISDIPDEKVRSLIDKKILRVFGDYSEVPSCDVIVICVPTPLTVENKPDYSFLVSAATRVAVALRKGQLVILESTVAPRTTDNIILPLLRESGLTAGTDFFLSFSPERIDPGNKAFGLSDIPKVTAGLTPACLSLACSFYETLGLTVIPVSTLAVAEMSKLLENTYRDINIALINEMAQVCRANGIDIWEVIDAAATKPFGFQAFYPGAGVGGHCVPVDSIYYSNWARASGVPAELAEHARRINAQMPSYVTGFIRETLADSEKTLDGSKILVLGVTYKKDTSDVRESSVIKLVEQLYREGAEVTFHDPFVEQIRVNQTDLHRVPLEEKTFTRQDCIVLAVDHSTYDLSWLYKVSPLIVDLTNALAGFGKTKLKKL